MRAPAHAHVWRSGQIVFRKPNRPCPQGAIDLPAVSRSLIEANARRAYDGKTLLVPGIPEAGDDDAAGAAIAAFCKRLEDCAAAAREPLSGQKAELYLRRAFEQRGRPDLAPDYDTIDNRWGDPKWRKNHAWQVSRDDLPRAVRVSPKSAPMWDPDDLDRYVERALERVSGLA